MEKSLTVKEVAETLRTSPDSIHQHWKAWQLPFYRRGTTLLMNPQDLRDWQLANREAA